MTIRDSVKAIIAVCASLTIGACGEKNNIDAGKTEISLSVADTISITIGDSQIITATVNKPEALDELSWIIPDEDIVSWEMTSNPAGADQGKCSSIEISAKALGTALVLANAGEADATCVVNVVEKKVESITLDKNEASLKVGETDHLSATISPDDATNKSIRWTSSAPDVASVEGAVVKAIAPGTAIITATCGACFASCTYTVSNIEAESISVDMKSVSISEDETQLVNLSIMPENATNRSVTWTCDDETIAGIEPLDANTSDNIVSCRIIAKKAGNTNVVATLGKLTCTVSVEVKSKVVPEVKPEVGDYYYSDGTWGPGYPQAPEAGKVVIGIVFQTDSTRISDSDKKDGYTHGYVVCTQLSYNPDQDPEKGIDKTVMYSIHDSFDIMGGSVLPTIWYKNIDGRSESKLVLEYAYRTYGNYYGFPAFDFTMTDFKVNAPLTSSGWFLPSTGQVWDMLSNFCGDEVKQFLKDEESSDVSVTYQYENTESLTYNPIDRFNEIMSLVPESMKEEFFVDSYAENVPAASGAEYPYYDRCWCNIITSSVCQYYEGEVTAACFRIGQYVRKNKFKAVKKTDGCVLLDYDWANFSYQCRPILAF